MPEVPTDEVETVLSYPSSKKLHLPTADDTPLCSCTGRPGRRKSIDVFPDGYPSWCTLCLELFAAREATGEHS